MAKALKVPVEAILNFDEETILKVISSTFYKLHILGTIEHLILIPIKMDGRC